MSRSSATYLGWGKGNGTTMQNAVSQIKAINPNTKVFLYTLGESLQHAGGCTVDARLRTAIESNKWWLYPTGTSGSKLISSFGNGHYAVNVSSQSRKNSAGQNFATWYGSWVAANLGKPVPAGRRHVHGQHLLRAAYRW